jgi:hypothetical protein
MANAAETTISFYPVPLEYNLPLYTVIGFSFIFGFIAAGIVLFGNRSAKLRALRLEKKTLEVELKHERAARALEHKTRALQTEDAKNALKALTIAS